MRKKLLNQLKMERKLMSLSKIVYAQKQLPKKILNPFSISHKKFCLIKSLFPLKTLISAHNAAF